MRPATISLDDAILTILWTDVERSLRVDIGGAAFAIRVGERAITLWVNKHRVLQKKPASLTIKRSTIGLQLMLGDKEDMQAFCERLSQATLAQAPLNNNA